MSWPVPVPTRRSSGEIKTGIAAFVVLSDQGWIATAAHLYQPQTAFEAPSGPDRPIGLSSGSEFMGHAVILLLAGDTHIAQELGPLALPTR